MLVYVVVRLLGGQGGGGQDQGDFGERSGGKHPPLVAGTCFSYLEASRIAVVVAMGGI